MVFGWSGVDLTIWNGFAFGGIGVFVFFGLSGRIMMEKVAERRVKFAVDRVRRLYPLYFATLGLTAVFAMVGSAEFRISAANVLLLPDAVPNNTLRIPYWSLVYEVFFYSVVFALLGRSQRTLFSVLALWAAAILINPFQASPLDFERNAYPGWFELPFSFYNLFFIVGCVASRWPAPGRPKTLALIAVALSLLGALALLVHAAAIPLGWLLLVYCSVSAAGKWESNGLPTRLLARIGDYSYGIYLLHILCLYVADRLLWSYGPWSFWSALAVMACFAVGPSVIYGWLDTRSQAVLKLAQHSVVSQVGRASWLLPRTSRHFTLAPRRARSTTH